MHRRKDTENFHHNPKHTTRRHNRFFHSIYFSLSLPPLTAQALPGQQSNHRHNTTECSHWIDRVLFTLSRILSSPLIDIIIILISVVCFVSVLFVLVSLLSLSLCLHVRTRTHTTHRQTKPTQNKLQILY